MNDAEIEDIYNNLAEKHCNQLNAFYQLRALFGPLVEGLILLDRMVYLLEHAYIKYYHLILNFNSISV